MLNIVLSIYFIGYKDIKAENAKNKAENAKVKAENAKLRQAMEENETRLAKLEQSDKEKAKLIAELNCDVRKIKQEQIVIDVAIQPSIFNKSLENNKFLVSHSTSQNTSNILLKDPNDSVETEANKSNSQSLEEMILELIDEDDIQVIDGNQKLTTDMTIEVKLAYLFLKELIELRISSLTTQILFQKKVRLKVPLEKSQGSVPKKLHVEAQEQYSSSSQSKPTYD
ncbi:hypothetical protein C1646_774701 [Rhizophagus diaphanus]|nr:hypothetical protein C1646_774701 [Rhizophagus diaphanus] [Rhizophagus sp. MUCL 43196]